MSRDAWVIGGGAAGLSGAAALVAAFGKARLGFWGTESRAWAPPLALAAAATALVLGVVVARRAHGIAQPPVGWAIQIFVILLFAGFFTMPMVWLMFEPLGILGILLAIPYAWFTAAVTVYVLRRTRIL